MPRVTSLVLPSLLLIRTAQLHGAVACCMSCARPALSSQLGCGVHRFSYPCSGASNMSIEVFDNYFKAPRGLAWKSGRTKLDKTAGRAQDRNRQGRRARAVHQGLLPAPETPRWGRKDLWPLSLSARAPKMRPLRASEVGRCGENQQGEGAATFCASACNTQSGVRGNIRHGCRSNAWHSTLVCSHPAAHKLLQRCTRLRPLGAQPHLHAVACATQNSGGSGLAVRQNSVHGAKDLHSQGHGRWLHGRIDETRVETSGPHGFVMRCLQEGVRRTEAPRNMHQHLRWAPNKC